VAVYLTDEQSDTVDAQDLVALARFVLDRQRVPDDMEVALLLVDRDAMDALNRRHMGKEGPTDVLAFPIDEPGESPPGPPAVLGDVVLCPSVAAAQAAERDKPVQQELQLLTVHGLLHLLGMDHADPVTEAEMFGLTDHLLTAYRQVNA
jgi:probable rRNA maturation factor